MGLESVVWKFIVLVFSDLFMSGSGGAGAAPVDEQGDGVGNGNVVPSGDPALPLVEQPLDLIRLSLEERIYVKLR